MSGHKKIVKIEWFDHYSLGEEWYDADESSGPRILVKIGYLTHEDKRYYYVSSLLDSYNKTYSQGLAILKNCVKSFEYLCVKKDKK